MSQEEAVKKEEEKLELMESMDEEEKKAFEFVSKENEFVKKIIGTVASEISGRERRLENSRRHELAIQKTDGEIFKSIDNEYKERSWENYMKDRHRKRKWSIIYKVSISIIGLVAYMLGGYSIMFEYVSRFLK